MDNNSKQTISMAVDLKKYRFRVHRVTLHALGDPSRVQLMFDPDRKAIMLVAPSSDIAFGQEERYSRELLLRILIQRIQNIFPCLKDRNTYCLTGKLIPSLHAVFFPLSSLSNIENNEAKNNDHHD